MKQSLSRRLNNSFLNTQTVTQNMKSLCGIAWIICACHLGEGISDLGCFEGNLGFTQEYRVYERVTPKDVFYYVFDIYGCFDTCRYDAYVGVSHKNDNRYYYLSCLCGDVRPTGLGDRESCSDSNDDGTWTSPYLNRNNIRTALYKNNGSLCIGTTLDLQLPGKFPLTLDRRAEWHWSELSSSECARQCEEMCLPVVGISYHGDEADKYMTCQCSAQLPLDQETKLDFCPQYERWTSSSGGSDLWSIQDNSDSINAIRTVAFRNYAHSASCTLSTKSPQLTTAYPELFTNTSSVQVTLVDTSIISVATSPSEVKGGVTSAAPGSGKQSFHDKTAIIGGVVGGIAAALSVSCAIIITIVCLRRRKTRAKERSVQHVYYNTGNSLPVAVPPVIYSTNNLDQPTNPDNPEEPRYITHEDVEEIAYAEPRVMITDIYAEPRRNRNVTVNDDDVTMVDNAIYDEVNNVVTDSAKADGTATEEGTGRYKYVNDNNDDVTVVDNVIYDEGNDPGHNLAKKEGAAPNGGIGDSVYTR